MNSRYTYKAKRKDNQEWVYGNLIYNADDDKYFIDYSIVEDYESEKEFDKYNCGLKIYATEIDSETICQCTGLKDKNDNYIFENDMLENYWGDKKQILECKYYDTGLVFEDVSDYSQRFVTNAKIIGNKFDEVKE